MALVFLATGTQAATSKVVFASDRDGDYEIFIMNGDGSHQTQLTSNTKVDVNPVFCGEKIVFASDRDGNANKFDIFIMDADGSNPTNLTPNTATSRDHEPHCTATLSGPVIVFVSDRDANDQIYKVNGNGTGLTRLTNNSHRDWNPQWCGDQIVFARDNHNGQACPENDPDPVNPGTNWQLWIMSSGGEGCFGCTSRAITCTPFTPPGEECDPAGWDEFQYYWPTCHPDGQGGHKLAFSASQSANYGGRKIYRMPLCSSGCCADDFEDFVRLTTESATADEDDYPSWSLSGSFITFSSDRGGDLDVYTMDAVEGDELFLDTLTTDDDSDVDPYWGEVR